MLTPDFIRPEIDAINGKWREIQKGSERKGESLAIFSPPSMVHLLKNMESRRA
jgi:hypothetical protein